MTRGGAFEITVGSYDNRFGTRVVQARLPWRFLNSSIPVSARVYFYAGGTVGYVDALMLIGSNELGVNAFTINTFTVVFAGQNWSLREIWFYGLFPTYITNNTYTISAYTLGYVSQIQGGTGISLQNDLLGFAQGFVILFYGNEVDFTVPICGDNSAPQCHISQLTEYDQAIGNVLSGGLSGAETTNLTASPVKPITLMLLNVFGFGGMQLNNTILDGTKECSTNVTLSGSLTNLELPTPFGQMNICGQGHFFYVQPTGTRYFDYGLDVGNYSAAVPELGFNVHFLQWPISPLPTASFNDLFLAQGVGVQVIRMAIYYGFNWIQGYVDTVFGRARGCVGLRRPFGRSARAMFRSRLSPPASEKFPSD